MLNSVAIGYKIHAVQPVELRVGETYDEAMRRTINYLMSIGAQRIGTFQFSADLYQAAGGDRFTVFNNDQHSDVTVIEHIRGVSNVHKIANNLHVMLLLSNSGCTWTGSAEIIGYKYTLPDFVIHLSLCCRINGRKSILVEVCCNCLKRSHFRSSCGDLLNLLMEELGVYAPDISHFGEVKTKKRVYRIFKGRYVSYANFLHNTYWGFSDLQQNTSLLRQEFN